MVDKDRSERAEFLSGAANMFETAGLPRVAGKIFGALLVSERPQLSIDELAAEIGTSRASVSTMTRLLIQVRLIDRIGLPGDRRDYFRVKWGGMGGILKARLSRITEFRRLIDHALSLVSPSAAATRGRLEEVRDLYEFLEKEVPALIERWEAERRASRAGEVPAGE